MARNMWTLSLPRLGGRLRKVAHLHRERTMETRKRRRFTAEYKGEAVKRLEESGKALQQVAAELGVHANQLRGWRNERLAAGSAEALARQKAEAAELARLRRENKRLEQENEILKRAAAFFAREAVPS
jgi:transposase-like protein